MALNVGGGAGRQVGAVDPELDAVHFSRGDTDLDILAYLLQSNVFDAGQRPLTLQAPALRLPSGLAGGGIDSVSSVPFPGVSLFHFIASYRP
jgi:hypothetical protein